MNKIFYFYMVVFISVIFSVNIKAETLSEEEENYFANFPVSAISKYDKNPENLFAIIKPDKSVWIYGNGTTEFMGKKVTNPLKLMEDVVSVKFFRSSIYMLKSDGSLWYYGNDCYDKDSYASIVKGHFDETIKFNGDKYYFTENYKPIGAINEPIKIYEGIKKIISSSTFIKKDNSLWDLTYTESFDMINEKIMDDVSVKTEDWDRILKTDNTLWMSCTWDTSNHSYSMPVKTGKNICGFYENYERDQYFYLNIDGELYVYNNYNFSDTEYDENNQLIKLMDGVKKIYVDSYIFIIKEDNSLFVYKRNYLGEKPIKVMDNVYNVVDGFIIKDDGTLYLSKFKNGKFNTEKIPGDIKVRIEASKYEIISKTDFDKYTLLTKQIIEMQKELINDLNYITQNMIKNNSLEEQGKTLYDNKILKYENLLNQNKNFIITNVSNLDDNSSVIYLLNGEKKFLNKKMDNDFLTYDINDEQYNNSKRSYAINALCYRNNWRSFPSYVTNLFKDGKNTEAELDKLLITKQDNTFIFPSVRVFWNVDAGYYAITVGNSFTVDNIFNINLRNVKSYEIIKPSENIYNYYIIKITMENNNTYIMSGFNDNFDFYNGYMYPMEKGTAIGQNNAGNNVFIFDTSEKSDKVKGERILLDDILKAFIENDKTSQVYNNDIYIERKEKNINITIRNSEYKTRQNLSSESILAYPIFDPVYPLGYPLDKGRLAYKKSFCWENKNGVKYFISDVSIPLYEDENTLKFYMNNYYIKVNF